MKRIQNRLGSLCMAVVMLLSMAVTPAMAADSKTPPTTVKSCEKSGWSCTILALEFADEDWMNSIRTVAVNQTAYEKGSISSFSNTTGLWEVGNATGAYGSYTALKLAMHSDTAYPATLSISADGYKDLSVKIKQSGSDTYTATVIENTGSGGSGSTENPDTSENGTVAVSDVTIAKDNWNSNWVVSFADADGYVSQIQTVKVNDTEWTSTSYGPYSGGSYKKNIMENYYSRSWMEILHVCCDAGKLWCIWNVLLKFSVFHGRLNF